MKISILTSPERHPVVPHLEKWAAALGKRHDISLVTRKKDVQSGDLLFLISCPELIGPDIRNRFKHALVVHASNLPKGRGWSPHIWQILEGAKEIPVSLLEARDPVDTGPIWAQRTMTFEGHELADEINQKLFLITTELMTYAVDNFSTIHPKEQGKDGSSSYKKRTPDDSRLSIDKPLKEQFDLLRVADPDRFPAFFEIRGYRYKVVISKEGKVI